MTGYCCTQSACIYGVWDSSIHQCKHLSKENDIGQRICLISKDILEAEKMKGEPYPMFDSGCSSTLFNTARDEVIKKLTKKEVVMKRNICHPADLGKSSG